MMQIIGAGFGRTGTMSLSVALEKLGYRPCYHFLEIFKRPGHIKIWQAAADGQQIDWRQFLRGYQAGLDYPIAGFYKEIMAAFPEAKIILTVRDPDKWYASTRETIYQGTALPDWIMKILPPFRGLKAMVQATTWQRLFDGKFEDQEIAKGKFEAHIAEVRRVVPPERLLVFHVKEGWGPLCEFLGVAAPDSPFPHINDRKTTKRMFAITRALLPLLALLGTAAVVWLVQVFSAAQGKP